MPRTVPPELEVVRPLPPSRGRASSLLTLIPLVSSVKDLFLIPVVSFQSKEKPTTHLVVRSAPFFPPIELTSGSFFSDSPSPVVASRLFFGSLVPPFLAVGCVRLHLLLLLFIPFSIEPVPLQSPPLLFPSVNSLYLN